MQRNVGFVMIMVVLRLFKRKSFGRVVITLKLAMLEFGESAVISIFSL